MDLVDVLDALCGDVPEAIGAIVCDFEGELVVHAAGPAPVPEHAVQEAADHIPEALSDREATREFVLRLAAAEVCTAVRQSDETLRGCRASGLQGLEMRFAEVDLLVHTLPDDYYVVLAAARPALLARARMRLAQAARGLAPMIA